MRWLVLKPQNRPTFLFRKKAIRLAQSLGDRKERPPLIEWLPIIIGVTERFVALTLVLTAPAYLPAFIGGWVALKFAIGWQRVKLHDDKQIAEGSFVGLIGNVISFAIPIAVGLVLYPEALNAWHLQPK